MTTDDALAYVDRVTANGPGTVPTEGVLHALAAEVRRLRREFYNEREAHRLVAIDRKHAEAECAALREQLREASAVCACGRPDSEHEVDNLDGLTHDCEYDCIRVSPAVASVIASLRDQIRLLREASSEQDVRFAGVEVERDHYQGLFQKTNMALGIALIELSEARTEKDALAQEVERLKKEVAGTRKALEHEHFARELAESQRDALVKRWEDLRDWMAAKTVPDYYMSRWIRGYVTLQTTTLAKMRELEDQQ